MPKNPVNESDDGGLLKHIYQKKVSPLINQLSKDELNDFLLYLPCLKPRKKVIELVELLVKYHPQLDSDSTLNLGYVYQQLYKNKRYNQNTINNLFTETYKAFRSFLQYQQFRKDTLYQTYAELKAAYELKEDDLFNKALRKYKRNKKSDKVATTNHFYYQYLIAQLQQAYEVRKDGWAENSNNLDTMVHSLQNFYMGATLRLLVIFHNRQFQANEVYTFPLEEEICHLIAQNPAEKEPYIQIWYEILQLLRAPEQKIYFDTLKDRLQYYKQTFPIADIRQFYSILINYCWHMHLHNPHLFQEDLFELFDYLVSNDILQEDDYFVKAIHFPNAVKSALAVDQIDWAKDFINKFESAIHPNPQTQKSILQYCNASIAFYEERYADCLNDLEKYKPSSIFDHVSHKILLIQTHYALNDDEALRTVCHSLTMFLKRNKVAFPTHHHTAFTFFVSLVLQLTKLREEVSLYGYSPKELAKEKDEIWEQIRELKPAKKVWLEAKVKELG